MNILGLVLVVYSEFVPDLDDTLYLLTDLFDRLPCLEKNIFTYDHMLVAGGGLTVPGQMLHYFWSVNPRVCGLVGGLIFFISDVNGGVAFNQGNGLV